MKQMERENTRFGKTYNLVLTALMTALVLLATYVVKIPTPATEGYIHLGDAAIFLSVLILGKKYGSLASGLGSALADLLGGYSHWVPWTFFIKAIMAYIMGIFIEAMIKRGKEGIKIFNVPVIEICGMVIGGIFMSLGYAVASAIMKGNIMIGILGIPANLLQFGVGVVLASVLAAGLYATPSRKYFAYRLDKISSTKSE